MNTGELNFENRQKYKRELIIPHQPVFVLEEETERICNSWYFTSKDFVTLRKKKQNTSLADFVRLSNNQRKLNNRQQGFNADQQQSEAWFNKKSKKTQLYDENEFKVGKKEKSLVLLSKQHTSYVGDKLKHFFSSHLFGSHACFDENLESAKGRVQCETCEGYEKVDYEAFLTETAALEEAVSRYQHSDNNTGLNKKKEQELLEKLMKDLHDTAYRLGHKGKVNAKEAKVSSQSKIEYEKVFNRYLSTEMKSKYSIVRIEEKDEKYNYLKSNQNFKNYRQECKAWHKKQFGFKREEKNSLGLGCDQFEIKKQQENSFQSSCSKIREKIVDIYWSEDFLIFNKGVSNQAISSQTSHNSKATQQQSQTNITSHMRQKLQMECQVIRKYLQNYFQNILQKCFAESDDANLEENKSTKKVSVKAFRLWMLHNEKNNHFYTLSISQIKVQCSMMNRESGSIYSSGCCEFYKYFDMESCFIDLNISHVEGKSKLLSASKAVSSNPQNKISKDCCQLCNLSLSDNLSANKIIKRHLKVLYREVKSDLKDREKAQVELFGFMRESIDHSRLRYVSGMEEPQINSDQMYDEADLCSQCYAIFVDKIIESSKKHKKYQRSTADDCLNPHQFQTDENITEVRNKNQLLELDFLNGSQSDEDQKLLFGANVKDRIMNFEAKHNQEKYSRKSNEQNSNFASKQEVNFFKDSELIMPPKGDEFSLEKRQQSQLETQNFKKIDCLFKEDASTSITGESSKRLYLCGKGGTRNKNIKSLHTDTTCILSKIPRAGIQLENQKKVDKKTGFRICTDEKDTVDSSIIRMSQKRSNIGGNRANSRQRDHQRAPINRLSALRRSENRTDQQDKTQRQILTSQQVDVCSTQAFVRLNKKQNRTLYIEQQLNSRCKEARVKSCAAKQQKSIRLRQKNTFGSGRGSNHRSREQQNTRNRRTISMNEQKSKERTQRSEISDCKAPTDNFEFLNRALKDFIN